jgi:gluconokinase
MAAGRPLDDMVRAPWLAAITSWLAERAACGECAVGAVPRCGGPTATRCAARAGMSGWRTWWTPMSWSLNDWPLVAVTFMPGELLASQHATLEPLAPDEPGITVNLADTATDLTEKILRTLPWGGHGCHREVMISQYPGGEDVR